MENKRLFLAIPPEANIHVLCDEFIEYHNINPLWLPKSMRHITLLFIGSFPAALVQYLVLFIEKEIQAFQPFCLNFNKFTFAPPKKPSMIWAQFKNNAVFDRYIIETDNALRSFFQEHDLKYNIKTRKNNIPHITLSRLKNDDHKRSILKTTGENTKICMPVSRIQLMESQLLTKGAKYFLLHDFGLSAGKKI